MATRPAKYNAEGFTKPNIKAPAIHVIMAYEVSAAGVAGTQFCEFSLIAYLLVQMI
jgi:hypothetical protein